MRRHKRAVQGCRQLPAPPGLTTDVHLRRDLFRPPEGAQMRLLSACRSIAAYVRFGPKGRSADVEPLALPGERRARTRQTE